MKLAAQYTRASMLVTVLVLIIAGGVYYLAITYIANQQFDRELTEEYSEAVNFIAQHQRFPKPFEFDSYQAHFEFIGQQTLTPRFADTLITSANSDQPMPGRAIVASVKLKGANYRMAIIGSKASVAHLMQLITLITGGLLLVLLLALFFINRLVLHGLWKPFFILLDRLKNFSITGQSQPAEYTITTDEFCELRSAIDTMEAKAAAEYETLKIFTENASHEMVTPVAVITSKLDNLIQDETLTEAQMAQLQDIYNAGNKLSRLSQSLLLLVKIDHQLIKDTAPVKLDYVVMDKIGQFAELTASKSIVISSRLQPVILQASPYLLDILLNNLLVNAIRHNHQYGQIRIELDEGQLNISNTGAANTLDEAKIFERFQKSPASEGTGLGLTIAFNICKGYGWQLNYQFEAPYHTFSIRF